MTLFSFINDVKLNKKTPLIKHIVLLIAILIVLVIAVFAWFSADKDVVSASGLNVSMKAGGNLLISLNGTGNDDYFRNSIDILSDDVLYGKDQNLIGAGNKLTDPEGNFALNMDDITSDGLKFYRPVFSEENGIRTPDTTKKWNDASKNRSYITQTVTFRTDEELDIFMGSGTRIITSCEKEQKSLVSDNAQAIGNKNQDYNFSNDCIVGALRISAVDSDGNLCFVCIPRSDIELVRGETVTMNTGQNVTDEAKTHYYYSSNYLEEGAPVTNSQNPAILGFDGTQQIATTEYNDSTGYYEATATINIWLEGCDSETTRLLSGGKFQIVLDFVAR